MKKRGKMWTFFVISATFRFRVIGLNATLILMLIAPNVRANAGAIIGSEPVAASQQKKVTGKITDEKGLSLPGVSIVVKGTTTGVTTDADGTYSIQVSDPNSVLVFSFIGFTTKEVSAKNQTKLNVVLAEDVKNIDEVVVVGYGTQKKSHLTGSVASLKTEGLDEIPVSGVSQAMQGKMAGVQIQQLDPMAGQSAEIRIRGFGSISASTQPLVVVDGFPVPDGLSSVSMGNVESIEVLKDAASAAMYGSRASGGVILVTTDFQCLYLKIR